MHIHIGLLKALLTFTDVIIVGFFWRWLALYFSDGPIGKAMGFIY